MSAKSLLLCHAIPSLLIPHDQSNIAVGGCIPCVMLMCNMKLLPSLLCCTKCIHNNINTERVLVNKVLNILQFLVPEITSHLSKNICNGKNGTFSVQNHQNHENACSKLMTNPMLDAFIGNSAFMLLCHRHVHLNLLRQTGHQIRGTSTGYWRTTEWGELAADIGNRKGCAADERMGWQDWR